TRALQPLHLLHQLLVDIGVDAADEKARHATDLAQVAALLPVIFESGKKGLHHFDVALDPKDQRDIDVHALADHRLDRRPSSRRATSSAYTSELSSAFAKMVGFAVTPLTPASRYRESSPERIIARSIWSSQTLWPRRFSSAIGLVFSMLYPLTVKRRGVTLYSPILAVWPIGKLRRRSRTSCHSQ